jgi:hypothetical protein
MEYSGGWAVYPTDQIPREEPGVAIFSSGSGAVPMTIGIPTGFYLE